MLYFFSGTDRDKARAAMNAEIARVTKIKDVVRITDTHMSEDLRAALRGPGMFPQSDGHTEAIRVLVFEGILANDEMRAIIIDDLPTLGTSNEIVFWYEEKPDALARRRIEKYAKKTVRFDAPKKAKDNSIFSLASALQRGDKKALWVDYQSALAKGNAPEAIHGILFWGAKKIVLTARKGSVEWKRGTALLVELAELPHEARRHSFDLEYALERYILNINKV